MPTELILAQIKKLNKKVDTICDLLHGLYRHSKAGLVQPPIPGLAPDDTRNDAPDGCVWTMPRPGEIAKRLPRQWSDVVKVFDALCERFGAEEFATGRTFDAATVAAVNAKTSRAIQPQTVNRMLSYFVVAGAASRPRRGVFRLEAPTDELRVRIEEEAKTYHAKMNARHAAKEAARA